MKIQFEIKVNESRYKWIQKMSKSLAMKGVSEFLARELEYHLEQAELWLERALNLKSKME